MTKTLTEQWREGTLPCGAYYVNRLDDVRIYLVTYENQKNTHEIYEILAPVPSYDKVKEMVQKIHILNEQNTKQYNELCEEIKKNNILEKKLEIATKALKRIDPPNINFEDYNNRAIELWEIAHKALKEMEGVK